MNKEKKLESNNVLPYYFANKEYQNPLLLKLERNKLFSGKNTSDKKVIHGNAMLICKPFYSFLQSKWRATSCAALFIRVPGILYPWRCDDLNS